MQESVALNDLVSQAHEDEDRARPEPLSDSNRVVIMMIKKPFIALRYRLGDGKVGSFDLMAPVFSSLQGAKDPNELST